MTFSTDQNAALAAPLDRARVATRTQSGRQLSYLEGWWAEAEANRIFGFDGWSSVITECKCVHEGERSMSSGKGWGVTYTAVVRVTVDGVTRDGAGAGHGIDRDLGLAHESALKEATTDAEKRAFKTFGNPFGLALYDKTQANVADTGAAPANANGGQIKRLNSAEAKRVGLDVKIKTAIDGCADLTILHAWDAEFDRHTAECPVGWLDSIKNQVLLKAEDLMASSLGNEMDESFRATIGPQERAA